MLKQISKVIFWSVLLLLFCWILKIGLRVEAANNQPRITKAFYNPSGSSDTGLEWIEIYNPGDSDLDLSGYDVYTGHYHTFQSFILEAQEVVKLNINKAGADKKEELFTGIENQGNMSDVSGSIAIFTNQTHSSSTIVDFVQYGASGKTWQSAAVSAGIWTAGDYVPNVEVSHLIELTDQNVDNNLASDWQDLKVITADIEEDQNDEFADDEDQLSIISILEARNKFAGERVKINGTVTILPNKLSEQYFYIQDATAGIQIYCYKKDFPELVVGDAVEVIGEISDYYTDKRVKIINKNDILIISRADPPPVKEVKIDDIGEELVGQIVSFEGEVSSTSGNTFYMHGSGEIKISIKEQTQIDKPRMAVGDKVRIIGVVSKYKDTYQVLPFEQAGVTILTSGKLPGTGKKDSDLSKSILILSLWKLSPKMKRKLRFLQKTTPGA